MGTDAKTVLVIDDEPDIVTYLTALLEEAGYATVTAQNGEEATARVKASRPDLITLDITMPEKSGVRFYREMREDPELKDVPIIVITGIAEEFERFISTRKQVPPPDGYIAKPLDPEKLLALASQLTD